MSKLSQNEAKLGTPYTQWESKHSYSQSKEWENAIED